MPDDLGQDPVIALLGASGYVGGDLLAALPRHASRVVAVSRSGVRPSDHVVDRRLDLAVPGSAALAVREASVVVHAAAYGTEGSTWRDAENPASDRINVEAVRELVEVLSERREAPLLVYLSSVQAGAPERVSRYAEQKIEVEHLLERAGREGVVRSVVLRLPTIYGVARPTGQTGRGVVAAMARKALEGSGLTLWNDGAVRRDLLHVHDATRAVLTSLEHQSDLVGGVWELSSGRTRPLRTVFEAIAHATGAITGLPPVPVLSVPAPAHAAVNDFRDDAASDGRFTAITGWSPQVSLEDGVRGVVEALHEKTEVR
ncbi:MAG: NAD(P)-dependent oxidoreductase [Propionibacteriales bacterium]|nr:NAD(P)-dependent oxidoreductase [Propionibacteriales bacterium]